MNGVACIVHSMCSICWHVQITCQDASRKCLWWRWNKKCRV